MRFRSVPAEIEAVQWTGDNFGAVSLQLPGKVRMLHTEIHAVTDNDTKLSLQAGADGAQGWVPVPEGHWLVHQPGDLSDVWPVDPDYFAAKYLPAGADEVAGYEEVEPVSTFTLAGERYVVFAGTRCYYRMEDPVT